MKLFVTRSIAKRNRHYAVSLALIWWHERLLSSCRNVRSLFIRWGSSIQVGPRQYANIYQIFRECVRDLDVTPEPVLFISQDPFVNALALGQEFPSMVINSGLLDLLDDHELRTVIAHELGHIKCGHTTLVRMALWVNQIISGLAERTFGLSNLVTTGLLLAFAEWKRKAELSADRASLLVTDDLTPVLQSMMKMAGGSTKHAHEVSLDEFIRQSERYQELDQDGLNQVYKFLLYNNLSTGIFLTHPFTVERVHFLREWSVSGDYQQIRQGKYPRAGAEGSVDMPSSAPKPSQSQAEVEALRRQIEDLQREIDRARRGE